MASSAEVLQEETVAQQQQVERLVAAAKELQGERDATLRLVAKVRRALKRSDARLVAARGAHALRATAARGVHAAASAASAAARAALDAQQHAQARRAADGDFAARAADAEAARNQAAALAAARATMAGDEGEFIFCNVPLAFRANPAHNVTRSP